MMPRKLKTLKMAKNCLDAIFKLSSLVKANLRDLVNHRMLSLILSLLAILATNSRKRRLRNSSRNVVLFRAFALL